MTKSGQKKVSIRTRILMMVLLLIVVVFLVIFVVFNLLAGEYIESSVREQLQTALDVRADERPLRVPPDQRPPQFIPDIRLPREPIGRGEGIIVSDSYQLLFPDRTIIFPQRYEEVEAFVSELEAKQVDLGKQEIMPLRVLEREYYYISVPINGTIFDEGAFLVYFIDMTSLAAFSHRINVVLLMVMGIAGILAAVCAVFISGKIAQPIRELTHFALRIGEGDFRRNGVDYGDLELSELARSMNRAAEQLDTYDREQKAFFQNASHELRTPLQSIKCSSEGIEHGILDAKKASQVISSETDRLSELVEDLLYLSRMDSITTIKMEEWDLRDILSNCAERQMNLVAEKGLQFVFDFPPEPVNMACDENHLSRAFSNLIANAIRYANHTIILSCGTIDDQIVVTVKDDGQGIAESDLPHIFDRFYKGRGGKHGIGLSIVKSVVEQHGGKIEARNTAVGAAFHITF
ncbi:MAG: HAMP domain-containing histidine kinase [Firmicutes bacterium]|nr:HAMP domain-containing histidine kinase [Bacillota bacterium]